MSTTALQVLILAILFLLAALLLASLWLNVTLNAEAKSAYRRMMQLSRHNHTLTTQVSDLRRELLLRSAPPQQGTLFDEHVADSLGIVTPKSIPGVVIPSHHGRAL